MQRPDVEFNLVERPKLPEQIGDTKVKIYEVAANQKCPFRECNNVQCHVPWHKPCAYSGPDTVKKIWPMVLITVMSKSTFGGLMALAASGVMLLVALLMDRRRMMWFRILTSIVLGVYIFVLSILKIHYALVTVEKDPRVLKQQSEFLLSTACIIGLLTLLASVVHFAGNVAVFTYYNMRFIHPIMFEHAP
ncbi:uncharacterized protein isoform X2 [Choristoneura fumiferana]|uniref:uncharacterized protein isoform X2 n=1 Tax=Choristoneura fumiferana TaxID=7141 RepID=UPI003D15C0F5